MNSHLSSPFELAHECSDILPTEIINKIFTDYKGLVHPVALLIKKEMQDNYLHPYVQLDYYVKYEGFTEDMMHEEIEWIDMDFLHFNLKCETGQLNPDNRTYYRTETIKYNQLWDAEIDAVAPNFFEFIY